MLLAQVDPTKTLADGLGTQFLPYALAICLLVIAFLFKLLWDQNTKHALALETMNKAQDVEVANLRTAHASEVSALQADRLARVSAAAEAQQALLLKVLPLQNQLAEMIRLTSKE